MFTGSSDLGLWKGHLLVLSGEGGSPAYVCPVQQLPFLGFQGAGSRAGWVLWVEHLPGMLQALASVCSTSNSQCVCCRVSSRSAWAASLGQPRLHKTLFQNQKSTERECRFVLTSPALIPPTGENGCWALGLAASLLSRGLASPHCPAGSVGVPPGAHGPVPSSLRPMHF